MSNPNSNSESFYTPPTTPSGDRDWRREVNDWMRQRNNGAQPIDLNTMVVIDNLLDALDDARKQRDETRGRLRAARNAGAWRYISNPNDRIQ
jgi:hypothetical protein